MPTSAWRWKPSCSGSVTATIWITPLARSCWTRRRTAASESPTSSAIGVGRRPSRWSASMIARLASSSSAGLDRRGPMSRRRGLVGRLGAVAVPDALAVETSWPLPPRLPSVAALRRRIHSPLPLAQRLRSVGDVDSARPVPVVGSRDLLRYWLPDRRPVAESEQWRGGACRSCATSSAGSTSRR